jgi:hypothetical protein
MHDVLCALPPVASAISRWMHVEASGSSERHVRHGITTRDQVRVTGGVTVRYDSATTTIHVVYCTAHRYSGVPWCADPGHATS